MKEIWGFKTCLIKDEFLRYVQRFETKFCHILTNFTRHLFENYFVDKSSKHIEPKLNNSLFLDHIKETNYSLNQKVQLKYNTTKFDHYVSQNPIEKSVDSSDNNCQECEISDKNSTINKVFKRNFNNADCIVNSEVSLKDNFEMGQPSDTSIYYGVCLPAGITFDKDFTGVYENKKDALLAVKKYKGSRFKVFHSKLEAEEFAQQAPEKCQELFMSIEVLSLENRLGSGSGDKLITGSTGDMEKPCPFKVPKPPELIKLRKAIEVGDVELFNRTIWNNPRYLISSGDTPVILQEGSRYNALHVSAKAKQSKMSQVILATLENLKLFQLLYDDDTEEMQKERMIYIVDLYLNTPDKALCETPLHFASKFGSAEIVDILASHPVTDRNVKNNYNQTPLDVVCSRCPNASSSLKKQIEELLEDRFIVPVFRDKDNSVLPIVGEPLSPEMIKNEATFRKYYQNNNPTDPDLSIKAFAGPMSPIKARDLHRKWKTPASYFSSPDRQKLHQIRLSDSEKGLERIGRQLAKESKVSWKEYWSFLDCFCNLSEFEGLNKLESHLKFNNLKYTQMNMDSCDFDDVEALPNNSDVGNTASYFNMSCGDQSIEDSTKELGNTSISDSILTPQTLFRLLPDNETGDTISSPQIFKGISFGSPISLLSEKFSRLQLHFPPEIPTFSLNDKSHIIFASNSSDSLNKISSTCCEDYDGSVIMDIPSTDQKKDCFISQMEESSTIPIDCDSSSRLSVSSSSSDPNSFFTPPTGSPLACSNLEDMGIFIEGLCPSKVDLDVWRVLENVDINPLLYPYIYFWKKLIGSYQEEERLVWPSPTCAKFRKSMSTSNNLTPKFISTPIRSSPNISYFATGKKNWNLNDSDDCVFDQEMITNSNIRDSLPPAYNLYDVFPDIVMEKNEQ